MNFDGFLSREFYVQSGVPQGSNLGPLLFVLFINDIVCCVRNSRVLLYADDMKIFREINCVDDCSLLQDDLDRMSVWSRTGLKFNAEKCVVVSYTRKTHNSLHFQYSIDNTVLSIRAKFKDLGVVFDEKFSFSYHIIEICKEAYRKFGFLCRSGSFLKNVYTFKLLYFSLIRSRLEFGFIIWSPYHSYLLEMIEQIQIKFLRFLYYKRFGIYTFLVSYSELLTLFQMDSLRKRRNMGMLVFLYKVVNGIVDCDELLARVCFLVPRPASRARALFSLHFARTTFGSNSPVNSMMRLGNALPDNVDILSSSLTSFTRNIRNVVVNY